MHYWGDENFDWNSLDKAIDYIAGEFRKWRLPLREAKEKFGTARVYCSLGWSSLLDIFHPGRMFYRDWPKWLISFDIYIFPYIARFLNFIVVPIHKWVYRKTYYAVVQMYPHIKQEICCMADFIELLDFYKDKKDEL